MRRAAPILLIGQGLDAITAPVTRPRAWWERLLGLRSPPRPDLLRPVSAQDRMDRYRDAAMIRPMYRDSMHEDIRIVRGWAYLRSWREGRFPRILKLRHLTAVPSTGKPARMQRAATR